MLSSVLFTHTDLDGAGCAVLYRLACKTAKYRVFHCTYKDIDEKIINAIEDGLVTPKTEICIADISPSMEVMKRLVEGFPFLMIWDHHRTALPLLEIFPMGQIIEKDENGLTCGTQLMFDHYIKTGAYCSHVKMDTIELTRFVQAVRSWDTWEWKKHNMEVPKELNVLFNTLGMEKFVNRCCSIYYQGQGSLLRSSERFIIGAIIEKEQKIIESVEPKHVCERSIYGYRSAVYFTPGNVNVSDLASSFLLRHPEFDIFIGIDLVSGTCQYRTSKDNIDVSEIAKMVGGGGHKQASGSIISQETKGKVMDLILEGFNTNYDIALESTGKY